MTVKRLKSLEISAEQVIDLLLLEDSIITDSEENEEVELSEDKAKKPRTCKTCGKPGHRSDRCPEKIKDISPVDELKRKTATDSEEEESIENGGFSRQQYSIVRERKHSGMTSSEVSDQLELDHDEVRFAFSTTTYESYLALR